MQSPTPGDGPDPAPRNPTSPIWEATLQKYYSELAKGGMNTAMIDKQVSDIRSPEDLLKQIEGLGNAIEPQSPTWKKTLSQLQPVILGLSDFAALAAWVLGMNGKVVAVLWGSIRLIVKVLYVQYLPTLPYIRWAAITRPLPASYRG